MSTIKMKFELGQTARDKVTKLTGTLTGFAHYLYGCNTYCLLPESKDGKLSEGAWFDEGRIEVLQPNISEKDVKSKKDGPEHGCIPECR